MLSAFSEPLAALTTVFTPPCPTSWLLTTTKTPSQIPPFPSRGPASCDPPGWRDNLDAEGFRFYSPAICPSGFSVGSNCAVPRTRRAEGFPAITDGETAVYCVPSGHTCTTDTTDFRGGVWGFSAAAPTAEASVVVGPAIQIRWRERDLSILKTHPLTPGLFLVGATATPEPTSDGTAGIVIVPVPSSSSSPAPIPATSAAGPGPTLPRPQPSGEDTITSPQSDDTPVVLETPAAAPDQISATQSSVSKNPDGSPFSPPTSSWAKGVGAIALSASLVGLVAVVLSIFLVRRYRRRRMGGNGLAPAPAGIGGWIDQQRRQVMNRFRAPGKADTQQEEKRDAELGIQASPGGFQASLGGIQMSPTELGETQPYGDSNNPAELDAAEAKALPPLPPRQPRPSWVSRISTRLSMRQKASAAGGHTSVATSRLTTTSSFTGDDYAAEWAAFAKQKWPSNSDTVNGLTCPPKTYENLSVPRIVVDADTAPPVQQPKGHARNGSQGLSRLSGRSDGTFGGSPPSPKSPLSPMSFHSPTLSPNPRSPRAFPKDEFP